MSLSKLSLIYAHSNASVSLRDGLASSSPALPSLNLRCVRLKLSAYSIVMKEQGILRNEMVSLPYALKFKAKRERKYLPFKTKLQL
jgi:hypothetical protein